MRAAAAVRVIGKRVNRRKNELSGRKAFYIRKGGNKYCADEGGKWKCNRRSIGKWERFLIKDIGGGRYRKWCADEGNKIKCNRGGIGAWEKFGVKHLNGNRFYLRGGRYNKWCRYTKGNVKCDRPRWNWGTQFRYKRL